MHFASALSRIMVDRKLSQYELADQSGSHQTAISLYVLGRGLPSTKTLPVLLKPRSPKERISLITAYLRDTANEIGVDPKEISILVGPPSEKQNLADVLDPDLYGIIYALAQAAASDPEFRTYLRSTANLLTLPKAPKPPGRGKSSTTPFPAPDRKKREKVRREVKRPLSDNPLAESSEG